ncbi:hypothetical protein FHT86_001435 [Rhizobium sp. BK313]|nr:hypothetical protein [Rhizobium sp. BK313]
MLDHVTIGVSDVERSKTFYDAALLPLGIERLYAEGAIFAGYGTGRKPSSGSDIETRRKQASTLLSRLKAGLSSISSMKRRWRQAGWIMDLQAYDPTITPTTTAHLFLIQTGTTLKPFVARQ